MNDFLIIDCFAGGGGASVGIKMGLGRDVDIAVNHDPKAILMHKTNHPNTLHLTEDIFKANLEKYTKGKHVALMWASPDCTSHSKAKGGKPRDTKLRILPWAVYKHAKAILPDVIIMENVEEIQLWGPLDKQGYPIKERKGEEYQRFIGKMQCLGYDFDCRELVAADYGVPTTRKRWYAIFRRDGKEIVWPEPTHNKDGTGGLKQWVPVHTVLDFSDLGKSIFGRKKPLADNTMKRTARGLQKFVFENPEPFIVQVNHKGNSFRGQLMKNKKAERSDFMTDNVQMTLYDLISDKYHIGEFVDKAFAGRELSFDELPDYSGNFILLSSLNSKNLRVVYVKDVTSFRGEQRLIINEGYAKDNWLPEVFFREGYPYRHHAYELNNH